MKESTRRVIPSEDFMILRVTTMYENGKPPLSPLGERVAHDGVFISRRGPGEGVPIFMAAKDLCSRLYSDVWQS